MAKHMLLSGLFVVCLFASVLCGPLEIYQTIMGVRVYDLDPNCAMLGGLCVKSGDCLQLTTKNGLCPSNQRIGVECCYELSVKEGSCHSYGGECSSLKCSSNLRRPHNDCSNGDHCCLLI